MTVNLRVALTIFSVGFAIEGAGEAYSVITQGTLLSGSGLLLLLPTVMTLVGLLFVWIGRHEWDELHRQRVRRAHATFGLSLLSGVVAGLPVGLLVYDPALGVPLWASVLFAAGVGGLVFGTFVTYVLLVYHLSTPASKVALVVALLWALGISVLVAIVLGGDLPSIVSLIERRSLSFGSLLTPVSSLASYLFVAYFFLFAAYIDAHHLVARGPPIPPPSASPPTAPGAG